MDSLKDLLQKRKPQQKSWVKQSDLQQKQREEFFEKQKILDEKQQQIDLQKLKERSELYKGDLENIDDLFQQGVKKMKAVKEEIDKEDEINKIQSDDEDYDWVCPLEKSEIILNLREINQPITLFGETDYKRYKRYLRCKETQVELEENNVKTKAFGQMEKNKVYKSKIQNRVVDETFLKQLLEKEIDMDTRKQKQKNDDYVASKITNDEKQTTLINWINKILKEWENRITEQFGEQLRTTRDGKKAFQTLQQCLENIDPLLKQLRKKQLPEELCVPIYQIAYLSLKQEYSKAHDKYLEVAIGNAPWPMGVTQVGIHERAGRSKIFSSQIAHVLNDESQRKYLQSIKRLVTVSQKLHPTDPSKMVNYAGESDKFF